jgi:hypothetical protein
VRPTNLKRRTLLCRLGQECCRYRQHSHEVHTSIRTSDRIQQSKAIPRNSRQLSKRHICTTNLDVLNVNECASNAISYKMCAAAVTLPRWCRRAPSIRFTLHPILSCLPTPVRAGSEIFQQSTERFTCYCLPRNCLRRRGMRGVCKNAWRARCLISVDQTQRHNAYCADESDKPLDREVENGSLHTLTAPLRLIIPEVLPSNYLTYSSVCTFCTCSRQQFLVNTGGKP